MEAILCEEIIALEVAGAKFQRSSLAAGKFSPSFDFGTTS
jgi:hypothetical protein